MREIIEARLRRLPEAPGVYRMLDAEGRIIYIGKSKCLKKRVASYFVPNPKWEKAEKMVRFIHDIEITVTDTHLEAMLLECMLIKEIKPYFNAMMKNDQKYFYLKVEKDCRRRSLKLVREKEKDAFGPLRSRRIVEELALSMRNLYPLEKEKRTYLFTYHTLPVVMEREQFEKNREILLELCQKPKAAERFIRQVEGKMKEAAVQERFELAMRYRDLLQGLAYLKKALTSYEELMKRDVVYTVPAGKGYKYFYIQDGLVIHTKKERIQSAETAARYAAEVRTAAASVKQKDAQQAEGLPGQRKINPGESYPAAQISDKSVVDFRAIIYGELCDKEPGAVLYEV